MNTKPERDNGPEGQAFTSRPFTVSSTGAVSRGTVRRGEEIEVRRMRDSILIDRMHYAGQLNDRHHRVARELLRMYIEGGLSGRSVTSNYRCVPEYVEQQEEEAGEGAGMVVAPLADGESWGDRLRRTLRQLPSHTADMITGLLTERHPGGRWLATTQAGLDRVGDWWGLPSGRV